MKPEDIEVAYKMTLKENDRLSATLDELNHNLKNTDAAAKMLSEVCESQRKLLMQYERDNGNQLRVFGYICPQTRIDRGAEHIYVVEEKGFDGCTMPIMCFEEGEDIPPVEPEEVYSPNAVVINDQKDVRK